MLDHSVYSSSAKELAPGLLSTPFEVQTNWHVIAGALSSGKTTLIGQFAEAGFQTSPEGARLYLEGEMAKGRKAEEIHGNWVDFQHGIAEAQLTLESELRATDLVIMDRAIPDSLAWWRVFGLDPNELLPKCFRHRYASIFILDRLPVQGDGLRPVDENLSAFLDEWTTRDYIALGYEIVRVPVLPPQERLEYIMERISGRTNRSPSRRSR